MPRKIASREPPSTDGDYAVADLDMAGQSIAGRERCENALDKLRARKQSIVRRKCCAQNFSRAPWKIHRQGREEPGWPPTAERPADFLLFEDRDIPIPSQSGKRGRETNRTGPDHDQPPRVHFFRASVFRDCVQCAMVPPPRITAATFNASAISSGEIPASAQDDAYESMQ